MKAHHWVICLIVLIAAYWAGAKYPQAAKAIGVA
jgi:hypothetical protein